METKRLRTLQAPSITQQLLQDLLLFQSLPPRRAVRVTDRSELPMALQRLVIKASKEGVAWSAWSTTEAITLCLAELSLDAARERGQPALKVSTYNEHGTVQDYSVWTQMAHGGWRSHSL